MKTPRYTDSHKYPHGYVGSASTNVAATMKRKQRELDAEAAKRTADQAEVAEKVRTLVAPAGARRK